MRSKEYTIEIKPVAWRRAGRSNGHFYDTQAHEKLAYGLSIAQTHGSDPKFQGPLSLDVIFYMPYPKRKRTSQHTYYHWTTPDKDYLLEHIRDSITQTGIVWTDRKQCAQGSWLAIYDKNPRVYFKITELT